MKMVLLAKIFWSYLTESTRVEKAKKHEPPREKAKKQLDILERKLNGVESIQITRKIGRAVRGH